MSDKQPANNSLAVLPEGIIQLTQTGYQTVVSATQFHAQIDDITAKFHAQGKKALILVDVSGVTGQDPQLLADVPSELRGDYDAMAIFGNSETVRMIVNWLIRAVRGSQKIQYFNDSEAAKQWLLSH